MRFFTLGLALCVLPARTASAAPKPVLGVSVAPSSATAGSANTLTFTFTGTDAGSGTASINVPPSPSGVPWSAPQVSNAAQPGYVAVLSSTCNTAGPVSVSGNTILVKFKCNPGKNFRVNYGAGAAKADAAQLVGAYTFATRVNSGSAGYLPTAVQPLVTVNPGPAASLRLAGLTDATAGTAQAGTVTALDAFGNVATGYGGTLHFTTTDTHATPPANTTASGGQASFSIALKTAGSESVTATDTGNSTVRGTATVNITALGISSISVSFSPTLLGYPAPSLPAFPGDGGLFTSCSAAPLDIYGNVATFSGDLSWASTDPHAKLPGCTTSTGCGTPVPVEIYFGCMFGTQGPQTVTVTDPNSGISGQTIITVIGPIAHADTVAIVDPTHNGTSLYTVNPLENDDQTSGLTGNILLGVFKNTIGGVTQQPGYTDEDGVWHQVGVMSPTADGSLLAWDMNPPPELTPPIDGEYDLCPQPPTSTVCYIPTPITAQYTITDGVNVSAPATMTFLMDTPEIPAVEPAVNVVWSGGEPTSNGSTHVTVSTEGNGSVQVQVLEQAIDVTATPTGPNGPYQVSIKFSNPVILSGGCDPQGCPTSVTLSGTAALPNGLVPSTGGSNLSAVLQPFLFRNPLSNLYIAGSYEGFTRATGFLPVLIGSSGIDSDPYVPKGYAGIFGFMSLSCQNATLDVNCPVPSVDNASPRGGHLYVGFPPAPYSITPSGCAEPSGDWFLGQPIPVNVDLGLTTTDASGTITVTIWGAHDQGSCTTNSGGVHGWVASDVAAVLTLPAVHGPGRYSSVWTPSAPGHYIIGVRYSGDFKNTTSISRFDVFNVH